MSSFLIGLIPSGILTALLIISGSITTIWLLTSGQRNTLIGLLSFVVVLSTTAILSIRYSDTKWNSKISDFQDKIKIYKERSDKINTIIVKEYIRIPIEKVVERNKIIKEQIPIMIKETENCDIPIEAIILYNDSIN